jgi:hypothetical protein
MLVARNCAAALEPDTMMKSSAPPNTPVALPPLVAAHGALNGVNGGKSRQFWQSAGAVATLDYSP